MTSEQVFQKFVPSSAIDYCTNLYQELGFEFKIKKVRQTKLGDYRYNPPQGKHIITINNDLNAYAFLITYLHEVAHLIAFKKYGRRILPHGKEWKQCFKEISKPMLTDKVFPVDLLNALKAHFNNPKASSCSDPTLYQILKHFDIPKASIFLKEIQNGQIFVFNDCHFVKLEKKRSRSVCKEVETHRKYLISELAEVFQFQPTK